MPIHEFAERQKDGFVGSNILDKFFSQWFHIHGVWFESDLQGYDRVLVSKSSARKAYRVEYKADWRAHETGNAFIETVSVDSSEGRQEKPGWAYSSKAEVLVYFVPKLSRAYVVGFEQLRQMLPEWERKFGSGKAANPGYKTHGLKVPLTELEKATQVILTIASQFSLGFDTTRTVPPNCQTRPAATPSEVLQGELVH